MNKRSLITLFSLMVVVICSHAQVIQPAPVREQLLVGLKATLGNTQVEAGDYSGVPTPFNLPKDEPEEVVKDISQALIVRESEPLEDATALRIVSEQFKPLGSMILGNRGVLQLGSGRTIEMGESFPAKISGHTYNVKITEVTNKGYKLQIGEAEVSKTFLTTSGATR